ncbi:hypothetical protein FIBSPDRAFT_940648, partial [Athelia psychrophila]
MTSIIERFNAVESLGQEHVESGRMLQMAPAKHGTNDLFGVQTDLSQDRLNSIVEDHQKTPTTKFAIPTTFTATPLPPEATTTALGNWRRWYSRQLESEFNPAYLRELEAVSLQGSAEAFSESHTLITLAVAASSRRTHHVLHEKRAAEPVDWVKVGRLQPGHVLPMRFGLSQQNLHMVEEMLTAISHPDSPNFGSHMSAAEVSDAFAPSTTTLHSV